MSSIRGLSEPRRIGATRSKSTFTHPKSRILKGLDLILAHNNQSSCSVDRLLLLLLLLRHVAYAGYLLGVKEAESQKLTARPLVEAECR